jgi:hypothetical protein
LFGPYARLILQHERKMCILQKTMALHTSQCGHNNVLRNHNKLLNPLRPWRWRMMFTNINKWLVLGVPRGIFPPDPLPPEHDMCPSSPPNPAIASLKQKNVSFGAKVLCYCSLSNSLPILQILHCSKKLACFFFIVAKTGLDMDLAGVTGDLMIFFCTTVASLAFFPQWVKKMQKALQWFENSKCSNNSLGM